MSLFDPSSPGARPSAVGSAEPLRPLRRAAARSRRRFLIRNGCCFAVVIVLPLVMGGSFGTGIGGGLTVSMVVFLVQAVLLVVIAARFDHDFRTQCDPLSAPENVNGVVR
ncbi:hypothetical protein C8250_034290 [Streptomyces sp. So13.3]|uniref:hypothetical protein n=1 Tax=Streptomyces TaxID=1883 RepID=UPI0011065AD9|nr:MULTISPECIES: hypothetical protein [unclassified Streptomyces]MCZ4098708.1 hypothetical protein [Streptomyces sp. H39-C1]QNA76270.1 hypothetical protein C8250_034290 [Streptomyces sp. So13.3]